MKSKIILFLLCFFTITFSNAKNNIIALESGSEGWPTETFVKIDAYQKGTAFWVIDRTMLNRIHNDVTVKKSKNNLESLSSNLKCTATGILSSIPIFSVNSTDAHLFTNKKLVFPVISLVGDAVGGWNNDTDMSTTDGVNYTLNGVSLLVNGTLKFRQDHDWALNWGGTVFLSGTGTLNGSPITVSTGGTYNVTFNLTTRAYRFTLVQAALPIVSLVGNATAGWGNDINMTTVDGVNYTLNGVTLLKGDLKFRKDRSWTSNWGGVNFPTGTAVLNSATNIPVDAAGIYNVTFNTRTRVYSFSIQQAATVSLVGDATGGWENDVDMTSEDGVNYSIRGLSLLRGALKLRLGHKWDINWGGSDFPAGTAVLKSDAIIPVSADGIYNITFNCITGAYVFSVYQPVISIIGDATGGWSNDRDMTTVDGVNFSLNRVSLLAGSLKFRKDHSWDAKWGGSDFPAGTAVLNSETNIPVNVTGTYNVTFNSTTGVYNFVSQSSSISLIGDAVGGWSTDIAMTTVDGINYSIDEVDLLASALKFRQNNNWDLSWGGGIFPSGTGIINANDGIVVSSAGKYKVTFNRITGVYKFNLVNSAAISLIGDATGGWDKDIDLATTDGVNYSVNGVNLSYGALKFRKDHAWDVKWGGSDFPNGTAVLNSEANMTVVPSGTYNITFNSSTGQYKFLLTKASVVSLSGDAVGGWDKDIDLTTVDGINYSINGVSLLTGNLKFRNDHAWDVKWGGSDFPSGVAVLNSDASFNVTPAQTYNVTFNSITGAYSFTLPGAATISVIGDATGGWDKDIDMATVDGVNYILKGSAMSAGDLKFRQNHSWDVKWGGTDFPAGTATLNGDANVALTPSGVYTITFNKDTGVYNFEISTFPYFIDIDADGYDNGSASLIVTSPPPGYSLTSLGADCNDRNASIHPGATEVANGVDDNCDGRIDEGTTPPAPIVSNVSYCKGAKAVALTATALPGYSLKWYTVATGGTAASVAPTPLTKISGTKTYYVAQSINNGIIGARAALTVTVLATAVPGLPVSIAISDANLCNYIGTTNPVTFTAKPVVGATSYIWAVPFGVNIVSANPTTNVLTVNFAGVASNNGAATIGLVTVKTANAAGCTSNDAKSLVLSTKLPTAPTTLVLTNGITTTAIKNVTTYIGSDTPLTLTAAIAPTGTSYQWILPSGVNQLSGGTDRVITINFSGVAGGSAPIVLGVKTVSGCGISSVTKTLSLTRSLPLVPKTLVMTNPVSNTKPIAVVDASYIGTTLPLTLTAAVSSLATAYEWELPLGVNPVDGTDMNSNIIQVNLSEVTASTSSLTFNVKAKNVVGVSAAKALKVTVLSQSAKSSSQLELLKEDAVNLYPNPTTDFFDIELSVTKPCDLSVNVYSIFGQMVSSKTVKLTEGKNIINQSLSLQINGLYFVRMINLSTGEVIIRKVLKQ